MKKQLERNIWIDYIFSFCRNFDVSSAVWVLYMGYRGLSLWQIGVVEGIFHAASFLFEVPSGALADLAGRKRVMILGRISSAVSSLILLFSTELWQFILGFVIGALSYNLNSGSEEALIYDSMKYIGEEEGYIKVNGRINVLIEIASGTATFLGGILAEKSFYACYITAAVIAGLSVLPALFLTEPPLHSRQEKINLKRHFKETYRIIKENPAVLKILLYYPIVEAFYTAVFFYGQQYFSDFGFSRIQISLLMLAVGVMSCLGALSSDKVLQIFGEKTKYVVSLAMGISILFVSGNQLVIAVAAFLLAGYVNALIYPIASASLNMLIPSRHRATIISVDSMFFSLAMICFFPAVGWIAEIWRLGSAFFLLGMSAVLLTVLVIGKER